MNPNMNMCNTIWQFGKLIIMGDVIHLTIQVCTSRIFFRLYLAILEGELSLKKLREVHS